jgi:uncharacterized protein
MRVLFDLVHPADALFFHHSIRELSRTGHVVFIASREKDVLVPLLNDLGHDHQIISKSGNGLVRLGTELIQRDISLYRLARQFGPDVMVGFGGVAISHVARLTGSRSLSFYDTEHAALQIRLALPLIHEWHVPKGWNGPIADGKTRYFDSGKHNAYLHPDHFAPSQLIATQAGLEADRENFLVRTVAWQANHDQGRKGIGADQLRKIIAELSSKGRVHLSAEGILPPDLEPLRYRGSVVAFHHLLAHCRAYVGESITVASEAVTLGVPALVQIDKDYGYITEQTDERLITRFSDADDFGERLSETLNEPQSDYAKRARTYVLRQADMNGYILEQIKRLGSKC